MAKYPSILLGSILFLVITLSPLIFGGITGDLGLFWVCAYAVLYALVLALIVWLDQKVPVDA